MTPQEPLTEVTADVALVGAGPTGLLSALLLAGRGHRVALVEQWPSPYELPRAVGISHDTLRALQSAGVIDAVMPLLRFTGDGSRTRHLITADGEVLAVSHDPAGSLSGWPSRANFSQPQLETALDACAVAHPGIQVLRGWRVAGVTPAEDGAVVEARAMGEADLGRPPQVAGALRVAARYVVGCDGANSTVRAGMPSGELVDLGFAHDWLVVDVVPHEERVFEPDIAQILGPPRSTTVVSGGPGRRRWEFIRTEGETVEELTHPDTVWRLLAPWALTPDNAVLERSTVYTFAARWAPTWRHGRVLLAGDAAHQMPPFLGEGFNSGVRDAVALAWHLDLVLRGVAGEHLLDAYGAERSAHVQQVIEQAVEVGRVYCETDPERARQRDARLRAQRDGPTDAPPVTAWRLGPGTWAAKDAHAGYLGVQGRVAVDGRVGRFDDLVGHGLFVLIGVGEDPAAGIPAELLARWAAVGGAVVHLGARSRITDVDGTYSAWFAERGAQVALFRPDFYVAATGPTAADAATIITEQLERLA